MMEEIGYGIFDYDYKYRLEWVHKCIYIIQTSDDERRVNAFKTYIFKMMKKIVLKNIGNYQALMSDIYGENEEPLAPDELVSECYIVFNRCANMYNLNFPNNSFYFYLNKALSHCFYKHYQLALRRKNNELTDAIITVHPSLSIKGEPDIMEATMDFLQFTELEKRIANSRLAGKRTSEFLKENEDVNSNQYSKALKSIKEKMSEL